MTTDELRKEFEADLKVNPKGYLWWELWHLIKEEFVPVECPPIWDIGLRYRRSPTAPDRDEWAREQAGPHNQWPKMEGYTERLEQADDLTESSLPIMACDCATCLHEYEPKKKKMKNQADYSKYMCPYSHIEKECGHELHGPEGYGDTFGVWCQCGFRGPVFCLDPLELKLQLKPEKPRTLHVPAADLPEPMREEPGYGTEFYVLDIVYGSINFQTWQTDGLWGPELKAGLCFMKYEDAEKWLAWWPGRVK